MVCDVFYACYIRRALIDCNNDHTLPWLGARPGEKKLSQRMCCLCVFAQHLHARATGASCVPNFVFSGATLLLKDWPARVGVVHSLPERSVGTDWQGREHLGLRSRPSAPNGVGAAQHKRWARALQNPASSREAFVFGFLFLALASFRRLKSVTFSLVAFLNPLLHSFVVVQRVFIQMGLCYSCHRWLVFAGCMCVSAGCRDLHSIIKQ